MDCDRYERQPSLKDCHICEMEDDMMKRDSLMSGIPFKPFLESDAA